MTTKDAYLLERLYVIDSNIPTPDDKWLAVRVPQCRTVRFDIVGPHREKIRSGCVA